MTNLVTIFRLLVSLYPIIIDAIEFAETQLQGSGRGADKLKLVRETLEWSYALLDRPETVTLDKLWPGIQKFVAMMVAARNADGRFVK